MRLALEHGDLNYEDSSGWTPLSAAVNRGYLDMVTLLLKMGGDIEY
jgi:ankyrin repeat protein